MPENDDIDMDNDISDNRLSNDYQLLYQNTKTMLQTFGGTQENANPGSAAMISQTTTMLSRIELSDHKETFTSVYKNQKIELSPSGDILVYSILSNLE